MSTLHKMLLNEGQFSSLLYLVGINSPIDTITLENKALKQVMREFFGNTLDDIKEDYIMFVKEG